MGEKVVKKTEVTVTEETIVSTDFNDSSVEEVEYAFVFDAFFNRVFDDPEEVLDKDKGKSQREKRVYVCLKLVWENNTFLLPLRKNLPYAFFKNHKYKDVCYHVPSEKHKKAGLDFRKMIIVNDDSLYRIDTAYIPSSQTTLIESDILEIKRLAIKYIKGFKKALSKGRNKQDELYKFSALNNFLEELK